MHPVANFVVQRLVQFCHKERHFKEMLEVLVPSFEDFVWGTGSRAGIVVKVVESCKKYPELQKTCVDSILGVFHATEVSRQSEIANLILNMRTYEVLRCLIIVIPGTSICKSAKHERLSIIATSASLFTRAV